MKKFAFLFVVMLVMSPVAFGQKLPEAFKAKLDGQFAGWRFAPIDQVIQDYHRQEKFPGYPNLLSGDFDGNGQTDYAAFIVYKKAGRIFSSVVALLQRNRQIRHYILEKNRGDDVSGQSINLMKKGEKDFNHDTNREFYYRYYAIFIGIWEKGGSSYIYSKGRFISFVTSD